MYILLSLSFALLTTVTGLIVYVVAKAVPLAHLALPF